MKKMKKYKLLKEIVKTDGGHWQTTYKVGEEIIYNEFLGGYIKKNHYYKWELITEAEIEKNNRDFMEIKQ
jgi:hypothetical protein